MNILAFMRLLRPIQWLKNLMLLFPPFLGGTIFQLGSFSTILLPVVSFCIASSATYIINDLSDLSADLEHPRKRHRPLASGQISVACAKLLSVLLIATALFLSIRISQNFLVLIILYLLVSILYSLFLKNYPLIDLFCISSGFIFRLLAGGEAFRVNISEWLFLSVFLLAIFLSAGKRYGEKQALGKQAGIHRRALAAYPENFLNSVMFMIGAVVLVTYTMYVLSRHSTLLLYSVPLCCFGLLRYILRVHSGNSGDPTESLTRDLPLLLVGITWVVMVGWGIYGH
jgi:4-hydroxybenzoate polyprenyltransferase